jgi:hypothetical protein
LWAELDNAENAQDFPHELCEARAVLHALCTVILPSWGLPPEQASEPCLISSAPLLVAIPPTPSADNALMEHAAGVWSQCAHAMQVVLNAETWSILTLGDPSIAMVVDLPSELECTPTPRLIEKGKMLVVPTPSPAPILISACPPPPAVLPHAPTAMPCAPKPKPPAPPCALAPAMPSAPPLTTYAKATASPPKL